METGRFEEDEDTYGAREGGKYGGSGLINFEELDRIRVSEGDARSDEEEEDGAGDAGGFALGVGGAAVAPVDDVLEAVAGVDFDDDGEGGGDGGGGGVFVGDGDAEAGALVVGGFGAGVPGIPLARAGAPV